MSHGFINKLLSTNSNDGHHFHLLEFLYYTDSRGRRYRTATLTDGGSTPWWLWWCVPPFGKKYWFSFILHDGCFCAKIEVFDVDRQQWIAWIPTEHQSNWLIHDALISQGAGKFKRFGIYLALEWFGWKAFDEDRRKLLFRAPRT